MRYIKLCCAVLIVCSACQMEAQTDLNFKAQCKRMVKTQLAARDIDDPRVLGAMESVPRHLFMPERYWNQAYADHPVPIGSGQTISQPYIVALMTQSLNVKPDDKVLEIGTGSGYQAAVLSKLCSEVYTIEIVQPLAERAKGTLKELGYHNVSVRYGDGYEGWKKHAPYDKIMITAAAPKIPQPLIEQLAEGGQMILPYKTNPLYEELMIGTKVKGKLNLIKVTDVRFVPMTGRVQEQKD